MKNHRHTNKTPLPTRALKALFAQLDHGVVELHDDAWQRDNKQQSGVDHNQANAHRRANSGKPLIAATHPLRPLLPLLLLPVACAFVGIFLAEQTIASTIFCSESCPPNSLTFFLDAALTKKPLLVVLFLLLLALLLGLHAMLKVETTAKRVACLSLAALLVGSALGLHFWGGVQEQADSLSQAEQNAAFLTITSDARTGAYGATSTAKVVSADGRFGTVQVLWKRNQEALPQGMQLSANISFSALKERNRSLFEQGICGTVTISEVSEPSLRPDIIGGIDGFRAHNVQLFEEIGGEGAALMAGVLLGYREMLRASNTEQSFRATGLSHLIAVSGSHLVVVAGLLGWVLSKLPGRRSLEIALLIIVLALYVVLTGLQPSAIRAAVMGGVSVCAFFAKRRAHTPSALAAAALAMLLAYPPNAFSIGFWLSVFAVCGISLFCSLAQSWLTSPVQALIARSTFLPARTRFEARKHIREPLQALALTTTAQAATLPIAVPTFSIFPLISPLANLLVTPLVTLLVGGGMIALCVGIVSETLARMMLEALCLVAQFASWLAGALARVPFAAIPLSMELVLALVVAFAIAALLYWRWPRPQPKKAVTLFLAATLFITVSLTVLPQLNPPQLIMLDVGQGDALLIREGNHSILIDTGPNASRLTSALARFHVTKLDAVVITHLHDDHYGGLRALKGVVQVDAVLFAADVPTAQGEHEALGAAHTLVGNNQVRALKLNDTISLSRHLRLEVVSPAYPVAESGNAESLCFLLFYDVEGDGIAEHTTLLTGDAESAQVAQMLSEQLISTCDVLKVGHHGSRVSFSPEQAEALGVQLALISVGENNRYGHPSKEVIEALDGAQASVLRTDYHGDVTVTFSALALDVQCATMNL
ncbi:MAG: DNA internalization-related competence protein ComEC/Rec2 [Coriobacteriales bacterium]|jgi:competence protein ComEC|nr:DNA internalization-related competence protein ComEC/Rec2 [Coriobacteriales bacterium]